jgi:hypothetical protein
LIDVKEKGMTDESLFVGDSIDMKSQKSFLDTLDEIIQQWTAMWAAGSLHDSQIATKVQVSAPIY